MTAILKRNREEKQSRIPQIHLPRSIFPAKWTRKQTMNASFITPIMCKRVVPGDSWYINMQSFMRLNTQVVCPLDNLMIETFAFYGPDRLVWDNAKYIIGAQEDPNVTKNYIYPQIEIPAEKNTAGSLFNLLSAGRIGKKAKVRSLPFRLHNLIYNEYFRDTDCESPKPVNKTDSDDNINDFDLYRIHKSRDYFTNSTRDIQKGEPVKIPIGQTARLNMDGNVGLTIRDKNSNTDKSIVGASWSWESPANPLMASLSIDGSGTMGNNDITGNRAIINKSEFLNNVTVNLSDSVAAQISALRQAIMTEEFLEALNRGGTHYTDVMRNVYGVTIPDLTAQKPVYLGGTSTPLFTNPVIQTSGTGTTGQDTPQGNIAGYGVGSDSGSIINASFVEYGYIIVYAVVKAMPQYQQGIDRHWLVEDTYDEYNPYFINASDQAIKRGEIYYEDFDTTDTDGEIENNKTFGYIGRFDELRYDRNEIAGEFNSEYQYTLDSYTYAEKFEEAPENNADFMADKTYEVLDRTLAVQWEVPPEEEEEGIKAPQLMAEFSFNGAKTRPIPTHAIPKIGALI